MTSRLPRRRYPFRDGRRGGGRVCGGGGRGGLGQSGSEQRHGTVERHRGLWNVGPGAPFSGPPAQARGRPVRSSPHRHGVVAGRGRRRSPLLFVRRWAWAGELLRKPAQAGARHHLSPRPSSRVNWGRPTSGAVKRGAMVRRGVTSAYFINPLVTIAMGVLLPGASGLRPVQWAAVRRRPRRGPSSSPSDTDSRPWIFPLPRLPPSPRTAW